MSCCPDTGLDPGSRRIVGRPRRDRLNADRLDRKRTPGEQKGKSLAIAGLKTTDHLINRTERHSDRGIGALVLDVHPTLDPQAVRRLALRDQIVSGLAIQGIELLDGLGKRLIVEAPFDRALTQRRRFGQPHAIGRQHTGKRVSHHGRHRERIGDCTGMLAACAAKHRQGITGHVIAALHRDLLDGIGHVRVGDIDKALGNLFRAQLAAGGLSDGLCKLRKALAYHFAIERRIALRAEDLRKEIGLNLAEHDIGIGHGERSAPAIAGRARTGAGRIRPHPESGAIEVQDRAAAGGHRMNAHHRRTQPHTGHLGVEDPLEFPGKVRDIGGGAAHVKADHPVEAGRLTDTGHADDAARRP